MPERSALTQGIQVGVEATPGTGVAAGKQLTQVGFEPGIAVDMSTFRPMGTKYQTVVVPGKEWTEFDLSGVGSYSELLYVFSSCLFAPGAPSTIDTSARKWDFNPASASEDTVKTLTIEQGGAVRAHKFTYGLVTEFELDLSRDGCELSGSGIGQRISDAITLTATPTGVEQKPFLPTDIDVWLDTTSGALGTTKLTRVLSCNVKVGDRFNPVWVLNSTLPSFVAHVEAEPSAEITVLQEADAEGMAQLVQMRGAITKFARVGATSPDLAGAATQKYTWTFDAAVKVADNGGFSDEDGVYATEWTFTIVHDSTWTKAMTTSLINKVTAL
jgi:hypothetical protein